MLTCSSPGNACQKSSTTHPLVMLGRRSGQWMSVTDPEDSGNGDTTTTSPQIKQQRYVAGTRTMADSFTMAVLPFSKDKTLLEKYKNTAGGLRESRSQETFAFCCHSNATSTSGIGKLLESRSLLLARVVKRS